MRILTCHDASVAFFVVGGLEWTFANWLRDKTLQRSWQNPTFLGIKKNLGGLYAVWSQQFVTMHGLS